MDENKQAMIEADEFDMDTMLVMFRELQTKQIKATAEGVDGMTPEMRRFIDEAKASGVTRCPIRDVGRGRRQLPGGLQDRLTGGRKGRDRAIQEQGTRRSVSRAGRSQVLLLGNSGASRSGAARDSLAEPCAER